MFISLICIHVAVRRKYNFDNPGKSRWNLDNLLRLNTPLCLDGKVPLEADVMKVVYSAALPDLPRSASRCGAHRCVLNMG